MSDKVIHADFIRHARAHTGERSIAIRGQRAWPDPSGLILPHGELHLTFDDHPAPFSRVIVNGALFELADASVDHSRDYRGREPYGTRPDLPLFNLHTCGMMLSALAIWCAIILGAIGLGVAFGLVRW